MNVLSEKQEQNYVDHKANEHMGAVGVHYAEGEKTKIKAFRANLLQKLHKNKETMGSGY